jgi:hypothetical protein
MQLTPHQALQQAIQLMTAEEIDALLALALAVTAGREQPPINH